MPTDPQPIRLAIGPSPWAFYNRSTVVDGITYHFQETAPGNSKLSGMMSLQDSKGASYLILDFCCYARILDDGTVLMWRESGEKAARRIVFDCFRLSSLMPLPEPLATAGEIRERQLGIPPVPTSEHWEFSPHLEEGVYPVSIPHDWSRFEETLVLADHGLLNNYAKRRQAIFAFDWLSSQVEVFPQDWFNAGNYEPGYQWISRVARRSDGSIVGEGARLQSFELDKANRRVKAWLTSDPFHVIQ